MTLRAAVFASGRGSNFEVLADAGARRTGGLPAQGAIPGSSSGATGAPPMARGWEVVLLVTDRGQVEALERARARDLPSAVVPPGDDPRRFGEQLVAELAEHRVDLVLLAGYLRLVPPGVVRNFPNRILNLHPALLPAFGGRGMYGKRVHQAVLDSGARVSGATVHFVDEVYDRGAILAQWPVPVLSDDTAETLAKRVQEVEHLLYPVAVDALARALSEGRPAETIPSRGRHFVLSSNLPSFS